MGIPRGIPPGVHGCPGGSVGGSLDFLPHARWLGNIDVTQPCGLGFSRVSIAHRATGEKRNDVSRLSPSDLYFGALRASGQAIVMQCWQVVGGKLVSRLPLQILSDHFRPFQNNFRPIQTTSKHSDCRTTSGYSRPPQNHFRLLSDNFRPRQTTSDHFSWLGLMLVARWLLAGCSRAARWLLAGCSLAARWLPAKLLVGCSPVAR